MDSASYSNAGSTVSLIFWIIGLVVCIFYLVCEWILFKKAGKPGWACLIPIYSSYVQFDIIYGKGIKFLLLLVPFLNILVANSVAIRIANVYGKSTGFGIVTMYFSFITIPMLAFGSAEYQGPIDEFL